MSLWTWSSSSCCIFFALASPSNVAYFSPRTGGSVKLRSWKLVSVKYGSLSSSLESLSLPYQPQKGISTVSTQVVVSDLLFNNCFVLSYLLVIKYIHFLCQKGKKNSPLQFQPLPTHPHLSSYLYPDLSCACPSFKTETKHS